MNSPRRTSFRQENIAAQSFQEMIRSMTSNGIVITAVEVAAADVAAVEIAAVEVAVEAIEVGAGGFTTAR